MEEYNRAKTIKKYFEKIRDGEMELSGLREVLVSNGIETDEINVVIKQVDKRLIRNEIIAAENKRGKELFYVGIVVVVAGLLVTLLSFTSIMDLKGYGIITYGPICGGLVTAMIGKSKMNRTI